MKTCRLCKQEKEESEFHKDCYGPWLRTACKECERAQKRERYNANREKNRAYGRGYYEANKDLLAEYQKQYRTDNREQFATRQAARRAIQLSATPAWAELEKIEVVYQKAQEYGFEVDHIVPLKGKRVCGLHVWENLQLMTREDNTKKNNRHWPDM
jgi:hypothetical protein